MTYSICSVCEKRPASGFCCPGCLVRVTRWLNEIPELYQELVQRHQDDPTPSLGKGNGGARVGGTRERSVPIDLDTVDLLLDLKYSQELGTIDPDSMRPVLSTLDGWVCALRLRWYPRESLPLRQVPTLALWLSLRLQDVCEVEQGTPELAEALRGCVSSLRRALGQQLPKPEFRYGRCEKCRMRTLWWNPNSDFVECASCGNMMTDDEYTQYLKETVTLKPLNYEKHADPEVTESVKRIAIA